MADFYVKVKNMIRKHIFYKINRWDDSKDELRFKEDWWNMGIWDFIVFHWLGTRMFLTGIAVVGCIMGLIMAIYGLYLNNPLLTIFSLFFSFIMGKASINKIKEWRAKRTWTIYDVFLKETWIN